MQPFISLQDVSVRKYDKLVINHLDWLIGADQHWGITGETGSGKSTLLEALTGKLPFAGGRIVYQCLTENEQIRDVIELVAKDYSDSRILQSAAQYYQQRFHVYDAEESPTVREFLTNRMKPTGTIDESSVRLAPPLYTDEQIADVAGVMRITHLLDCKLMTLSNGETCRTLLTRSFLKQPKALLLDMPFIGLDAEARQILHQALNHIARTGTRIIIATTADQMPTCITDILHLTPAADKTVKQSVVFQESQKIDSSKEEATNNFTYAVQMRNVTVSYADKKVLQHINWEVKRRERWAVLGPNGSGKSTLLSLINGDNPQAYVNDIYLFDRKRGSGESIWDIKSRIGFVSPELHLYFPRQTPVFKAVASGLFNADGLYQSLNPTQYNTVVHYLSLLNISDLAEKQFEALSTGEQRQVLLARALVNNPPLLILDEPCQGLDDHRMHYFRDMISAICLQFNKTLLYVTHYPAEIPACVTKVLRLEAGIATM